MNQNEIMIIAVLFIVFFIIPVAISRRTGRSYMDVLTGWARKGNHNSTKSSDTSDDSSDASTASSKKLISNATKQDLLDLVSRLITISRKHNLSVVFPGTITHEDRIATLVALLVTDQGVIGFNCFGFGGTVTRQSSDTWTHDNGVETKTISNPTEKNREQYALVREALDAHGMSDIPLRIIGVFNNRHINLVGCDDTDCYTTVSLCDYLQSEEFTAKAHPDGKKIADDISALVKRS